MATQHHGEGRQQHQRQHHGKVLDDQPADGDAAVGTFQQVALLQGLQEHDGAGHREAEPDHQAGAQWPAPQPAQADAQGGRENDLEDGARHGEPSHRQQVGRGEVQPDAEHQQDDADLGQLHGKLAVGYEPGCEGPHEDSGQQVADQGRQAQPVCDVAEGEGQGEAGGDGRNQRRVMHRGGLPLVVRQTL